MARETTLTPDEEHILTVLCDDLAEWMNEKEAEGYTVGEVCAAIRCMDTAARMAGGAVH